MSCEFCRYARIAGCDPEAKTYVGCIKFGFIEDIEDVRKIIFEHNFKKIDQIELGWIYADKMPHEKSKGIYMRNKHLIVRKDNVCDCFEYYDRSLDKR